MFNFYQFEQRINHRHRHHATLFQDAVNNQNMNTVSRETRHSNLHRRVVSSQPQSGQNTLLNSINMDDEEERKRVYAEFSDEELRRREVIKNKRSEVNKRLASNYKYRIARFLENMAEEPIRPKDDY